MANNEQLIADLGEAINLSNAAQQRFGENNDSFNRSIQSGLAQINATIRDIDALLGQITDKINSLKARIQELQNKLVAKKIIDQEKLSNNMKFANFEKKIICKRTNYASSTFINSCKK